jgi:hypothetical protein
MKKLILICLTAFYGLFSQAQNALEPSCYLDSQSVNLKKVYVNPGNISSIRVVKDSIGVGSNGSVYIFLKQHWNEFLSLSDVIRINLPGLANKKLLFVIDGNVIKDTAGARIDPSFTTNIYALSINDLPFHCDANAYTDIVIIDMAPRKPINFQEAKPMLRIRGSVVSN